MQQSVNAIFGILEDRIIHLSTDEELKMIKNLVKDIVSIREESKASTNQNWAMLFIGGALSSFLTYITLDSGVDTAKTLVISLIFCTSILGVFFFLNWRVDKKKETSVIQEKEQQLEELFDKIEARIPKKTTSANKISIKETLELNQLS